jgi:cobalt-precorrin-5B (C1)-methyltransferase
METLVVCALESGAGLATLKNIASCVSTDAALDFLREAGCLEPAMRLLGERMEATLERHCAGMLEAGFVCFAKTSASPAKSVEKYGEVVCASSNVESLSKTFLRKEPL